MHFQPIDLKNWNRAETFRHFTEQVPCTYSMTVNLDVTRLIGAAKGRFRFFPVLLYGLSRTVNRFEEFRFAKNGEGKLGFFEMTHPRFTVYDEQSGLFHERAVRYTENFRLFYDAYISGDEIPAAPDQFNVSCIPWASFTGFNLNAGGSFDFFSPIFTVGKFYEIAGRMMLPLAIQVHHAVCDGFHAARFVNALQAWADSFNGEEA